MKRFLAFIAITLVLGGLGLVLIPFFLPGNDASPPNFQVDSAMPEPQVDRSGSSGMSPPKPTGKAPLRTQSIEETPGAKAKDAFQDANIAFQTPEVMSMGRAQEVELLFSLQKTVEELKSELGDAFPTDGATISSAPVMEATLTGSAFDILPAGPQRQAVRVEDNTSWEWSVTPQQQGNQTLKLRVFAVVNIQGIAAPMEIKTFERDIPVEVTIGQRVGQFAMQHPELVWVALVVPLAGFMSRWFRRKDG